MTTERTVPWDADMHTKAKHAVYERYLSKWTPIMLRGFGANITYAEGFSGPGVYTDGTPGSPVLALRSVLQDPECRRMAARGRMRFVFVDHDQRCVDRLERELARATTPVPLDQLDRYGLDMVVARGDCEPDLERQLDITGAWGRPMLVVLDTWGGGVSYDLISKVAGNPNSEVIITVQPQYFSRFAEVDDISHGDKVFGDTTWRQVAGQPSGKKERWLLELYRATVRKAGFTHVLDFELIDARGQALYLVFGTTHERGLQKMKEAMWEVDAVRGVGYRDPRDPNQETLDIQVEPHTAPLKRLIAAHVESLTTKASTILQLRRFALHATVFKESQVMPVVVEMLEAGQLARAHSDHSRPRFTDTVSVPASRRE